MEKFFPDPVISLATGWFSVYSIGLLNPLSPLLSSPLHHSKITLRTVLASYYIFFFFYMFFIDTDLLN